MAQQNLVTVNIPEKDVEEIKGAVEVLRTKLFP